MGRVPKSWSLVNQSVYLFRCFSQHRGLACQCTHTWCSFLGWLCLCCLARCNMAYFLYCFEVLHTLQAAVQMVQGSETCHASHARAFTVIFPFKRSCTLRVALDSAQFSSKNMPVLAASVEVPALLADFSMFFCLTHSNIERCISSLTSLGPASWWWSNQASSPPPPPQNGDVNAATCGLSIGGGRIFMVISPHFFTVEVYSSGVGIESQAPLSPDMKFPYTNHWTIGSTDWTSVAWQTVEFSLGLINNSQ